MGGIQFVGCVLLILGASGCTAPSTGGTVEATSFVLRDKLGRVRGVFGPIEIEGQPATGFEVFDEGGASRLVVAVGDGNWEDSTLVSLRDAMGRNAVVVGCADDGRSALILGGKDSGGEAQLLSDSKGIALRLEAHKAKQGDDGKVVAGAPSISILDAEGGSILIGKESWNGAPMGYFILEDLPGSPALASLAVDASGNARLALETPDDKQMSQAVLEWQGNQFTLRVADRQGRIVAEVPMVPIAK